ncbi:hypothetical protein ACWCOP_00420 [Maricaulaceae bacterium MS644]
MILEETGADFARDRVLTEAGGGEGLKALGHRVALTMEEDLTLEALKSGKSPMLSANDGIIPQQIIASRPKKGEAQGSNSPQ